MIIVSLICLTFVSVSVLSRFLAPQEYILAPAPVLKAGRESGFLQNGVDKNNNVSHSASPSATVIVTLNVSAPPLELTNSAKEYFISRVELIFGFPGPEVFVIHQTPMVSTYLSLSGDDGKFEKFRIVTLTLPLSINWPDS